jgi:FkbM family methyltransferase
LRENQFRAYDAVVCHNEVNDRHGTGILIQRLWPDSCGVISIRAETQWGGEQTFGARQLVIPDGLDRTAIYRWTLDETREIRIARIFCIPFSTPEVFAAIALRDALQVPLCLYLMDDQNVTVQRIPDDLMGEAIRKATVRLAISSDMRDAYEAKYASRFWIAPPTIPSNIRPGPAAGRVPGKAIVVGNIWGWSWFAGLRATVRTSGLHVDWFANTANGGALNLPEEHGLVEDGIYLHAPLPEADLASRLAEYQVALIPTVPADGDRENEGVASLSLPSKVPFLIGASDLPIVVLGDESSCVARFVRHFKIGDVCPYDGAALSRVIESVSEPEWRETQSKSLAKLREIFAEQDLPSWLAATVASARPPTLAFEELEVSPRRFVPRHLDELATLGPWLHGLEPVYAAFQRLAAAGYLPDFVVDVGASTGVWSYVISKVFPYAAYVLIDPLYSRYDQAAAQSFLAGLRWATVCETAVGAVNEYAVLHVDQALYGASLVRNGYGATNQTESLSVTVRTLDSITEELPLAGRGILKLDIQGGEIAALRGARRLIDEAIDVVVTEVTLDPAAETLPSFADVDRYLVGAGFVLFDDVGWWREPRSGALAEKDVLYVRRDSEIARKRRVEP